MCATCWCRCNTSCSTWAASSASPATPPSSMQTSPGWKNDLTTTTKRCRRSRISSCPAAARRQRAAMSPAPWCAAPSARPSPCRARNAYARRRSVTSTGSPTCCSCWRGCWRGPMGTARFSGATNAARDTAMARILGYTHPACLEHDPGPGHPECADRLGVVLEALHGALPQLEWIQAPRATRGQLLRVHDPRLLATVLSPHPPGGRRLDPDTVASPGSPEAALRAVGAGIAAIEAVLQGEADVAFCAVRPPGHHATVDAAMGFCLFNNIAVAAAHALDRFGLARVAIIDF